MVFVVYDDYNMKSLTATKVLISVCFSKGGGGEREGRGWGVKVTKQA